MEKNTSASILKISLVGPECTGKSTLASLLAKYYDTVWVPEYAREYIDRLDRPYQESDLPTIAKGQVALEDEMIKMANRLLICDTDLTVIKIWSEHKYGACYPEVLELYNSRPYDLHILTGIDVPWDDDPQRENPQLRQFFYDTFKNELIQHGANFIEISGTHYERQKLAVKAIDELLEQGAMQ